ncbi:uncharacterized protein LOC116253108 isoform X2 [Nymphaea colorata]|uniref:uncharacterized protein LOC116253108 isoform X2 n=1 Tax=Nymphaea colorata TaxID=210225 RepID=UPI00214E9D77|nr:uncharacterized protein LOC116253108 isoform X2 [Nymphaea colorata]
MDDCLKLLKGEKDEQKFAGLLLATRLCQGNDDASVRKIYDAVGFSFLNRLLRTGLGKGGDTEEREDYLKLAVTVLATFCRLPEVASSTDMLSTVPLILEILRKRSDPSLIVECYECLLLIGSASQDGPRMLFDSGAITVLSSHISILPDGTHLTWCMAALPLLLSSGGSWIQHTSSKVHWTNKSLLFHSLTMQPPISHNPHSPAVMLLTGSLAVEVSMRLLLLILNELPLDMIILQNSEELAHILIFQVVAVARPFGLLHSALKFDALHLLSAILSFHHMEPLHQSLISRSSDSTWGNYIGVGITAVLQNRVGSAEKIEALILAESMINIFGESWLVSTMNLPDAAETVPADRCLLLVLETSRIEIAVLLNELAYLKYEASKDSTVYSSSQGLFLKQRNLAMAYSLMEKIIKLISSLFESEGISISEGTLIKAMSGISETISLVFDFLQDAKEHGQRKGDDLLASVRIIGSFLAETPFAMGERVGELLDFILSVEGEAEESSLYSICFLLPMLCQTTTEVKVCKTLLISGAHKLVIKFLVDFIRQNNQLDVDKIGTLFFACETVINILVKVDDIQILVDVVDLVPLLQAFAALSGNKDGDSSIIMMASSICILVLGITSEDALTRLGIDEFVYDRVCQLILWSLEMCRQGKPWKLLESELDLGKVVTEGYICCASRFPHIKQAVERSVNLQHLRI